MGMRVSLACVVGLWALLPVASADPPSGRSSPLTEAAALEKHVAELLASKEPDLDAAEHAAGRALDLKRRKLGAKHAQLASAYRTLAAVHEARARGEPRLLHLEPALHLHERATQLAFDDSPPSIEAHALSLLARGRLLQRLYLSDESWPEYVRGIDLVRKLEPARPELLADALEGVLEAFDESAPTPKATAARWQLAAAAKRLLQTAGEDGLLRARAAHAHGRCLSGSADEALQVVASRALEDAVARYRALGADPKRHVGRALLDLARHHWDCGNLATYQAPYWEGRELRQAGQRLVASSMQPPFVWWMYYAGQVIGRRKEMPEWLLRDGAEEALREPGRIAEAWYAMLLVMPYPLFFQRAAARDAQRLAEAGVAERPAYADALVLEGMVAAQSFDFDGAAKAFERAVELYAELGDEYAVKHARSIMDSATVHRLAGRLGRAADFYENASAAFEKVGGLQHEDTTKSYGLHLLMTMRNGDLERASKGLDRVLTLTRENKAFAEWLDSGGALSRAGGRPLMQSCWLVAGSLGRPGDQREIRRRFGRFIVPPFYSPIQDLVVQGRYRDVLLALRNPTPEMTQTEAGITSNPALGKAATVPGAMVGIRRGIALLDVGSYEEAFAAADAAIAELERAPINRLMVPWMMRGELRAATLLARSLRQRGLVREAAAISVRAFRLQCLIPAWSRISKYAISSIWRRADRRFLDTWLAAEAIAWWALTASDAAEVHARCLDADGEPEKALEVLEGAVDSAGRLLGPTHPRMIRLEQALGAAAFRAGRLEVARTHLQRAHEAATKALGAEHPMTADAELTLADLDVAQKAYAGARKRYAHVLKVTEAALFDSHINHVRARSGTALALSREGKTQEALVPMREAVDRMGRRILAASNGATTPERLALMASAQWVLTNWLEVCGASGKHGYAEVLRVRGLAGRLMAADRAAWKAGSEKTRPVHEALREAQRRLARIVQARPNYGWSRLAWRRDVARQTAVCDELTRKLGKISRSYEKTQRATLKVGVKHLRGALKKGEVLVDFLATGGRYTAWIVNRLGEPVRIDLGPDGPLEDGIDAFVSAVDDAERGDDKALQASGAKLRALLWKPIASALPEGTKTVYVVPDGWIAATPLAALPGSRPGRVLAEEVMLVHLSSPHDLLPQPGPKPRGRGLLVIGGVNYNSAEKSGQGAPVVTGRPLADLPRGLGRYVALPDSAVEAERVKKALAGSSRYRGEIVHLVAKQATEGRLRESAPGKAVIHLATHAYVRDHLDGSLRVPQGDVYRLQPGLELHANRFDPMLMSGVVLAGANTRVTEGEDDGVLTALEASHLDLTEARLVVLSACESARGVEQAAQGTLGLVRGFRVAGARNVIGSLWKVDDEQTAEFMKGFYARWLKKKGMAAARALRETALAMRRGELTPGGRAPRHWAAFVAYGPLR